MAVDFPRLEEKGGQVHFLLHALFIPHVTLQHTLPGPPPRPVRMHRQLLPNPRLRSEEQNDVTGQCTPLRQVSHINNIFQSVLEAQCAFEARRNP